MVLTGVIFSHKAGGQYGQNTDLFEGYNEFYETGGLYHSHKITMNQLLLITCTVKKI